MKRISHGALASLASTLTVLLLGGASRTVSATFDLTGTWHVQITSQLVGPIVDVWDITQSGTTLSVGNGGSIGTIDPVTGTFSLTGTTSPFPLLNCPPETFTGRLTPDGKAFSGTEVLIGGTMFCPQFPSPVWASRDPCGNGVLDPGEACDDGNEVNGDGCDANCTLTGCGNDILTAGEQCEDGNVINGDGCSANCTIEPGFFCTSDIPSRCTKLIPGAGKNGCTLEWFTEPITDIGNKGFPVHQLKCTDDDPLCDFGAAAGDNACTFHVALCLNVSDTRFPCTPTDLTRVQLLSPSEANPATATAAATRDAVENALTALGGTVAGQCNGGRCRSRFVEFGAFSAQNACTPFAPIQVPLRQTASGVRRASRPVYVTATAGPLGGPYRALPPNPLTLICKPHP